MALSDKDILITPNKGQTAEPKIEFKGASATQTAQTISLNVYPSDNGTISFEGSAGQLFSITNNLSGTIYSVNDVSGIPSIEVLDTGLIKLGQYNGNILIGKSTDDGTKLQINGGISTPTTWINYSTANYNGYNENIRLYPAGNNVSTIAFGATGVSGTPWNSVLGYSDRFEIRQADQWQLRSYANYIEAYGSSRAPTFYDSNDTGYYTDPAATSNLLGLTVTNTITGSITGNAATATSAGRLTNFTSTATTSAGTDNTESAVSYISGISLFGQSDGALYSHVYNSSWKHNIYGDYRTGQLAVRGKNNGTWTSWRTIWDSSNLTNLNQLANGPGYITGESDTLATVTARGASTSTSVTLSSNENHYSGHFYYDPYDAAGNHYVHFNDGSSNGGVDVNWRLFTGSTNSHTHIWNTATAQFVTKLESTVRVDAPIFYDRDDTGYYVDPNATSNIKAANGMWMAGTTNAADTVNGSTWYGLGRSDLNGWYSATMVQLAGYYGLRLRGSNSILDIDGSIGNGTIAASTQFRAPIFYDSDDTSYYLDPASTTTSLQIAGAIEQGSDFARPNIEWSASGTSTGMVIFKLPGTSGNYGMVHMVFDYYEYSSPRTATIIVSGHNWNSSWYQTSCNVVGYIDKEVRLGYKDGQYCVVFGGAASSWNYGTVRLRKIHNGGFYNNIMNLGGTYSASQTTTESFTAISGDLRELRTPARFYVNRGIPANAQAVNSSATVILDHSGDNLIQFRNTSDNGTYQGLIFSDNNQGGYVAFGNAGGAGDMLRLGGYWSISFDVGAEDSTSTVAIKAQKGYIDSSANLFINGSVRAPIFYDSDNTAYYADPASTSNFNIINANNIILVDGNLQLYKHQTVDMSDTGTYSTSNYYPVIIGVPTSGVWIEIQNNLNSNAPSWSTHPSGFTINLRWWTNGSGWGTTEIKRRVDQYHERFTNLTICGGITQMGNSSTEVVWLRGGGTYYFKFSRNVSASAQSTTYTVNSQSVSPTSTEQNDVWSSATGTHHVYYNTVTASSNLKAPIFYDSNDTNYYINPASGSVLNYFSGAWNSSNLYLKLEAGNELNLKNSSGVAGEALYINYKDSSGTGNGSDVYMVGTKFSFLTTGIASAAASFRSQVFYDTNDTAYYADPASTSRFNNTHANQHYVDGWFRNYTNNTGLYNENTTQHLSSSDNGYWDVSSTTTVSGIRFYTGGHKSALRGYIYSDTSNNIGFLNTSGNWTFRVVGNDYSLADGSSMRAQLYYDSNDTGYYLNPNSDSNLYRTSTYLAGKDTNSDWAAGFRNTPTSSKNFHGDISSGGPTGTWWFYESMRHSNSSSYWGTQIAYGWEDNANEIYQRNVSSNSFSSWVRYLNSNNYSVYAQPKVYRGVSNGDWQNFTNDVGEFRIDQVNDITNGSHSNHPTGIYSYGAVMSWRGDNHSMQLYAAHTGALAYKTQWNNDNSSGWRQILHDVNNSSLNDDSRNTRGVTRLYRRDDNSDYSVQTYWTGSYWRLYGYNGDTGHADTHVGYADSAGNSATAAGANGYFYIDDNYGYSVVGLYDSTRLQGVFAMGDSYKLPADGASTSNMYGIAWSHPNAGTLGGANNLTDHGMLIINNGGFRAAISNSAVLSSYVKGTLFYDYNDTGYYVDPASTSNLVGLTVANTITGSVSGNAGTVAGLSVHSGRNNEANKVVRTDSNGYLQVGYINSSNGNENNASSPPRVWGTNGSDDYLRTYQTSALSVGYATSAGSAPANGGTSAAVTINYNNDSNSTYQMLWGSGNSVYGTGGIYCNPSTDILYAAAFYDANDSAYYCDPNGTSHLGNLDVASRTLTSNYYDAAIEVREYNYGGAQTDSDAYQPRIGFHWGGRVASSISMNSSGWLMIRNNPGTGYENFIAANIYATGNVTAYYSDERLKTKVGKIENAIDIVRKIETFKYINNEIAKANGFVGDEVQVGVSAQSVEKVIPEVVKHAPFDMQSLDGETVSKSGEWYKTVQYDRLVPVLIEAIKEQQSEIEQLKNLVNKLLESR